MGEKTEATRWANVAASYNIDDSRSTYNIACVFSVLGDFEQALRFVARTLDLGVPRRKRRWMRLYDSDLDELCKQPRFDALFTADSGREAS